MPIPSETSQKSRHDGKLSKDVQDIDNDFREKLSLGEVPRLRRKTKVVKHEEDPHVFSVRSGRKLSVDKVPPSQKKPTVTKSKENTKDMNFRSFGTLLSGKVPPAQKKPIIKKSKEDTKDNEFGFVVKQQSNAAKRKADTSDIIVWSDDDDMSDWVCGEE